MILQSSNIKVGRCPFTPAVQKDMEESHIVTVECERCDYRLMLMVGWNSWKGVTEGMKRHLKDAHGIKLQ